MRPSLRTFTSIGVLFFAVALYTNDGSSSSTGQKSPPIPWLGIAFSWANGESKDQRVLHIQRVTPGGPAALGGLKPGDLVLSMNAIPVRFGDDLDFLLFVNERTPGERLNLVIVRNGARIKIDMVVGIMPEASREGWRKSLEVARKKRMAESRKE